MRALLSLRAVEDQAANEAAPLDFSALAREHEPALRSVALRLCRGPSDAQDLVQDTLERALRNAASLPGHGNLRAWLLAILRNRFIDSCRRRSRETSRVSPEQLEDTAAANDPEPEPAWASITHEQVRAALEKLPGEFRAVYQLHAIEHRSYAEISAELRIPKATVGTRLLRARKRLKALLIPDSAEEDQE